MDHREDSFPDANQPLDPPGLQALLATAVAAARVAGEVQRRRLGTTLRIEEKGPADLTTEVDLECERVIVELLRSRHPEHSILGEEGTATGCPQSVPGGLCWFVDPLDGTKNFTHGYRRSCVSIAVATLDQALRPRVLAGAIYNPAAGELFTGLAGGGAYLDGLPIRVSSQERLDRAMIASALGYDPAASVRAADRGQLERLGRVLAAAEAVRCDGCCALDLCDVACGRLDAYFEGGLKPWDTAAGALIVREAGGRVTTFDGAPHSPSAPDMSASNGMIHEALAGHLLG